MRKYLLGRTSYHQSIERHIVTVSTDTTKLANVLFDEAMAGRFSNTIEQYLDEFRNSEYPNFYTQALEAEGEEVAEARLLDWAKTMCDQRVADALAPIITSLSQLLEVEHRNIEVKRFDKPEHPILPFPYKSSEHTFAIAVTNPEVPGCGCAQAKGADKFSLWGELGITSFVVIIDPLKPEYNSLVLMLPLRDIKKGNENRHGFVTVSLSRDGKMGSTSNELFFYKGAAEHLAFGGDEKPYRVWGSQGGGPCDYVGFPGAQEYITSSLGELDVYLSDVAEKLSGQHKH